MSKRERVKFFLVLEKFSCDVIRRGGLISKRACATITGRGHAIQIITVSNFRGRKVKDSLVQHILKDKKQSCVDDDDDDLPCDNETQKPLQSPTVVSALRSRSISVREGRCRFAEFIGRRRRRSAEGMGSFGGNSRGFIRLRVCVYFLHAHQSADPILMLLLLLLLLFFLRGCHFNIFLLISLLH